MAIKSITQAIRNSRNSKSTKLSARTLKHLPYSLSIESLSEVDTRLRKTDTEAVKQFNDDVRAWGKQAQSALKSSVRSLVRNDVVLSRSIRAKAYYDRSGGIAEVNRVGFSFAREGIFIHHGARRGRGGYVGSSWLDRHGERKFRASESAGKMSGGIKWFDPVIEDLIPQLADIVANYSASLQINATNLLIEK